MESRHLPESTIEHLDFEPRPATFPSLFQGGPPPPYRSLANVDDAGACSECSTSTLNDRRRYQKSQLVTNRSCSADGNLNSYSKLPKNNFANLQFGSARKCATSRDYPFIQKLYSDFYSQPTKTSSTSSSLTGQSSASEFMLMPMYSLNKSGAPHGDNVEIRSKRDRMQELRQCWSKKLTKICCTVVMILIILAIVLPIVLTQTLKDRRGSFRWLPPLQYRMGSDTPTTVTMTVSGQQLRFDMNGDIPFKKSDYISVYDFSTRKVIMVDTSLKSNGKNLVCFVMNINSTIVPTQSLLEAAARNTVNRNEQLQGWQESWNYLPKPYFGEITNVLSTNITECNSARWIEIIYTPYDQKGQKCTECYDFCLPDYGIERDSLRGENYLNIVRRMCFNLYVPEWRSYGSTSQNSQRNFESYYRGNGAFDTNNEQSNSVIQTRQDARNFETKWISLQQVPQRVTNFSREAFRNTVLGATQNVFGANPNNGVNTELLDQNVNSNVGYINRNGYVEPYNVVNTNSNSQNGIASNVEQRIWEPVEQQGKLRNSQEQPQQLVSNGMSLSMVSAPNQVQSIYQLPNSNIPVRINDGISSDYRTFLPSSQVFNSQTSNGYADSGKIYSQEQPNGYANDNTRIRQVSDSYGNGQSYQTSSSFRLVDINNPMNGVNGNSYRNQHNFGGGTNFQRQAYISVQQPNPSRTFNDHHQEYPAVSPPIYYDTNQRVTINQ